MANPEHIAILKQGVEQWNRWRDEHPHVEPNLERTDLGWADLERINLSGASLRGANFGAVMLAKADLRWSNLSESNLRGADLREAYLRRADLYQACVHGADVRGADLRLSDLSHADLGVADLRNADLNGAELRQTDFSHATASGTNFGDVDLSTARGLETVVHGGPSTVGVDTIYKSRGRIPEIFLRGCGIPDNFIEYMRSLTGQALEFYSCFISYSSKDHQFADRLYADLQAKGVRCWFAPHDIKGGRKLHEQIDEAIRLHDKLLLILSEDSMKSEWVKTELAKARKREVKDGKRVLFPVRLVPFDVLRDWECFDADTGKDSAREIREYFIPDFSNWKEHDSYRVAFDRLVKDLKQSA